MTRTRRDGAFGGSCVGGEQQLPDGGSSCPRDNPDVGPSDAGGRTVGFHSCQFDDGGKRRLRFATEEEVVLTIRDASDRVVWRWKPERPYTSRPHEETLAPASCLFWSTRWAHVDDAGQPVPRGVYVLFVDYLELDDEFEHRNTFTY